MATDIVIQLRMLATCMERGYGMSTVYGAAEEIERLRAEIERLTLENMNKIKASESPADQTHTP